MKTKISLIITPLFLLNLSSCIFSPKEDEPVQDKQLNAVVIDTYTMASGDTQNTIKNDHDTATKSSQATSDGIEESIINEEDYYSKSETISEGIQNNQIDTNWKYTNEILIKYDVPYPIDKIDEILKKSNTQKAPIHLQYKLKEKYEIYEFGYYLNKMAPKVTTIEFLFPPNFLKDAKPYTQIHIKIPDDLDTRLILTGMGKKPLSLNQATIHVKADTLVIRNLKFEKQNSINALDLDVGKLFIGEDLIFKGNKFRRDERNIAGPLIFLKSHANKGQYSQYLLKNVSFIENNSSGLLVIDNSSRIKFDRIELDHVTTKDNIKGSINISATRKIYIHDSELMGDRFDTLYYNNTTGSHLIIEDSMIDGKVYGVIPTSKGKKKKNKGDKT